MKAAIRTVEETDDFHVIEGLGIPFGGPFPGNSDSYGTRATPKTDFHWDLFTDRAPTDPPEVEPQYVRFVTYSHGYDDRIGLTRIGGWSPVRQDKKGVWVRAQLDKHNAYYTDLRALLDEGALGFSTGAIDHNTNIPRSGDWKDWPAVDLALTPTESNPWAQIAMRMASVATALVKVTGIRVTDKAGKAVGPPEGGKDREDIPDEDFAGKDKSYPIVTPKSVAKAAQAIGRAGPDNYGTDELKANIIKIAKRKGSTFIAQLPEEWKKEEGLDGSRAAAFRTAADDAGWAMHIKQDILMLMGCESDEPDQLADLQAALDAMGRFAEKETAEIGSEKDTPAAQSPLMGAFMSAIREGRRNSSTDQALIDGIHDASTALGASAHADKLPPNDETHQEPEPTRSATALRKLQRARAKAVRKALRRAAKTGSEVGATIGTQEALRIVRPG